jgi:hypothetical protein
MIPAFSCEGPGEGSAILKSHEAPTPAGAVRRPRGLLLRGAARAAFCEKDPGALLITRTDTRRWSGPWHYDNTGCFDPGKKFAAALLKLQKR